jgi:hypothetical protein
MSWSSDCSLPQDDCFSDYKPIGAAPGAFFCWGGRGHLGKKVCNAPRATDFREERNPPQADSIVRVF